MRKKWIIPVVVAAILALGAFLFVYNQENFTGNRVKNPDRYSLDFDAMNQEDHHSMDLMEGMALNVHTDIQKGKVDLVIGIEGEIPIYTGHGMDLASFSLPITKSGRYRMDIRAKHAAGKIMIVAEYPKQ